MSTCSESHAHRKRKKQLAAAVAAYAAAVVTLHYTPHLFKTPQNTSILTGHAWVCELLAGHPRRFHNMMGISKHVFRNLVKELRAHAGLGDTRHIACEEQLAVFLRMCRTGESNRDMQERFQHSPDTISKIFHRLLGKITSVAFYNRYIKLPSHNQVPPEIQSNPKLYPFFRHCLGALDGSHIDAFVPDNMLARYRDRKGRLSQNVLAACTFDMRFSYVLSGWEGSAADGRIFDNARHNGFAIPPGKFYLADAGFPLCDALLVPYRGVRYHLQEWGRAPQRQGHIVESVSLYSL